MNKRCAYCGVIFRPKRSTGRYCSDACRKAASRKRQSPINGAVEQAEKAQDGLVTLNPVDTPPLVPVTLKTPEPWGFFWRWYDRLDGSCDLYRDSDTTMRHVARIVGRNGCYHLDKPSNLISTVWTERLAAQDAVRSLIDD